MTTQAEPLRPPPDASVARALVVVDHDELVALRAENAQLREGLTTRATIDQAKGMVMAELGCGPDEAFAALRRISSRTNVKIRDIAAAMAYHAGAGNDPFGGWREHLRDGPADA
jgi:AmiR/NasT family two-component response regulator